MKNPNSATVETRSLRLIEMMCEIKTNPRQKPEQFCHSLGISRAQFFKDRASLAQIGFVFDYDRKQGRYVIKKEPFLPAPDLTSVEALSLVMAVRQISAAGDHTLAFDAVKAIKKIISTSDKHLRHLLEYAMDDLVLKNKFKVDSRIIEELWQARERSWRLEIVYDDFSQQRERTIQIDPYTLFFKGRALYLDAFIVEEKRVKMLRASRVKRILRRVGNFGVREDYNFNERHRHSFRVMTTDKPPQLVKIKFAKHAARYVDESYHHESQQKLLAEDGTLLLTLKVSDPREVLWYLVFPWGDEAEILEPQWLREEAIEIAQNIVAKYQQ